MKHSAFTKIFAAVTLFTVGAWVVAGTLAKVSGTSAKDLAAKVERRLDKNGKDIHESKNLALEGITKINVEGKFTDVELIPGGDISADFTLEGRANADTKMEIIRGGDTVNVNIKSKNEMQWSFNSGLSGSRLRLRVALPKAYRGDMRVQVGSGDVTAGDLELNDFEIKSGSGDVKVNQVAVKNLTASSGSGDQKFSGKVERLTASTGSGDMSLHDLIGKSLTVSTGSGELKISDIQAQVAMAKTGSGDAVVRLGDLKRWTATAHTGSGEIKSNLAEKNSERHELTVGTGESHLNVQTGSGDVEISL